jgi:exopolyphosphatase / guanosine-5'-triphosphate,3'-diphosphate pyrophosphatase
MKDDDFGLGKLHVVIFTSQTVLIKIRVMAHGSCYSGQQACVVDIGSASIRILTGKFGSKKRLETDYDKGKITRLIDGIGDNGCLASEAMDRSALALQELLDEMTVGKPCKGICMGTQALRKAGNGAEFMERMAQISGYPGTIIDHRREGMLSWLGSAELLNPGDTLIDIGGGSTEWVECAAGAQIRVKSYPVGAAGLNMNGIFMKNSQDLPVEKRVEMALRNAKWMKDDFQPAGSGGIVILGGSATSLAAIQYGITEYHSGCVHARKMKKIHVVHWIERLTRIPDVVRESRFHLEPGRGGLIVTGAALILGILQTMNISEFIVSEHGIRFGQLRIILGLNNDPEL